MKLSGSEQAAGAASSFSPFQFHIFSVAIFTPHSLAKGSRAEYSSAFSSGEKLLFGWIMHISPPASAVHSMERLSTGTLSSPHDGNGACD